MKKSSLISRISLSVSVSEASEGVGREHVPFNFMHGCVWFGVCLCRCWVSVCVCVSIIFSPAEPGCGSLWLCPIRGSVIGSQYMCGTGGGSILQSKRWNVRGGSRVCIMNSVSLMSAPPSTVDIKRCHGFWSVAAYERGTACRRGVTRWRLTEQNDKSNVAASACQTRRVLICAVMAVLFQWGPTGSCVCCLQ